MALSNYEKISVIKYIKNCPMGEIYYLDICSVLRKGRKASYEELIEFFTEFVLDAFTNDKYNPNLLEKLISCISSMTNWCANDGKGLDSILFGKIQNVVNTYENYTLDKEGILKPQIELLKEVLDGFEVNKEDLVASYIGEISDLQKEIRELNKALADALANYANLEKQFKDKERTLNKKNGEVGEIKQENEKLNREIKALEKKIKELKEAIEKLENQVTSLEALKGELQKDNDNLRKAMTGLTEEVASLKSELLEVQAALAEKAEILKRYSEEEDKRKKEDEENTRKVERLARVEQIVLAKIAAGGLVIPELVSDLQDEYGEDIREDIRTSLANLRRKFNIQKNSFMTEPKYVIVPPKALTDGTFDITIPEDCKSYDILLVSDMHISKVNDKLIRDYDSILDYCANNNIRLILNAGDYFDFRKFSKKSYLEKITGSKKIVDSVISKIPQSEGIYQAVLGGNHDRDTLKYGFDAIKMLADEREDFITLGYDHVTITFNGVHSMLTSLMMHHLDSKFPEPVVDNSYNNEALISYLDDYYTKVGQERNNSYLDIIGHFHRSGLDGLNGICTIPSLYFDRYNNGAWHLKVYFDSQTQIKYMIFKPLDFKEKLIPTTEFAYQKLVLK